ncbi:hypothetical protein CES85_3778 (plasmid) [Ochrobactrum quorumnocens]|uniref:Uncharacterized protein n=1 Tax=Ochrobactrum quorumnocens TaxID=271865 RepID=A0A248UNM5_9HYPH|nr:hypothetical protein CES85_3778 [[Ochrobactrum] quorumnocens]
MGAVHRQSILGILAIFCRSPCVAIASNGVPRKIGVEKAGRF